MSDFDTFDQDEAGAAPVADPFADPGTSTDEIEALAEEAAQAQAGAEAPEPVVDYTVDYGGHTFTIDEPDVETVIRFMNLIGAIGMRGEQVVAQQLKAVFTTVSGGKASFAPPVEAMVFGVLSVVKPQDIARFGVLALFGGGTEREQAGNAFFRELGQQGLKLAPIVKALIYRIALSEDLREALGNFRLVRAAMGSRPARG